MSVLTRGLANRCCAKGVGTSTASSQIASRPSSLLRQLGAADARHFEPVLSRCPTLLLEAGTRLSPGRLSPAPLLVVEDGIVAIATSPESEGRPMTVAIVRGGDLLVPPHEGECLWAPTDAVVTLLPTPVVQALLVRPAVVRVVVERLIDAVVDRQQSLV